MATNKTQAASLLNTAEMAVFSASLAPAIRDLSAARLAAKVKRARTLRDKFRDLLQRQKIATRQRTGTKAGPSGSANERTARKAEVFDEVLQRFSVRLDQVQAAAARVAAAEARARERAEKAAKGTKAAKPATKKAGARVPAKAGAKTSVKAAVKAAVAQKSAAKPAAGQTPARSAKAPASAPGKAGTGVGAGSQRARTAAKEARLAASNTRPIQGHISSAGRRAQATRDGKA